MKKPLLPSILLSLFLLSLTACGSDNSSEAANSDSEDESSLIDDAENEESIDDSQESDLLDLKSCKRGVAYGYHSEADMSALSAGVSWWYNWTFAPDSGVSDVYQTLDVDYVPMYWGDNYSSSTVAQGITSDVQTLLGFNEPNFYSQANLSAIDAAELWPEVEAIADANDLSLVSPAVNYCGDGCYDSDPINYLNEFFDACSDCRVDAIAVHVYVDCSADSEGLADNRAQWLINHIENYKAAFTEPLWVTEFACSGSPSVDEQIAFMQDAVAYLESESQVARYAWFAGRADNMVNVDLLGDDGELTELGELYVSAEFNSTSCDE